VSLDVAKRLGTGATPGADALVRKFDCDSGVHRDGHMCALTALKNYRRKSDHLRRFFSSIDGYARASASVSRFPTSHRGTESRSRGNKRDGAMRCNRDRKPIENMNLRELPATVDFLWDKAHIGDSDR
jgi:hypothetical protein